MAQGYLQPDYTSQFNSVYKITLDLSGWDKMSIQLVAPVLGTISVQASNDAGAILATTQGDANTAINFTPVQVKNLATGNSSPYIYGAGMYEYDVNAKFFRLQGTPASAGTSIYRINMFNSKID